MTIFSYQQLTNALNHTLTVISWCEDDLIKIHREYDGGRKNLTDPYMLDKNRVGEKAG